MTRSYGDGPDRQKNKPPDLRVGGSPQPGFQHKLDSLSRYTPEEMVIKPVRVDFGKRLVAGIIDLFAGYLLAGIVALIPFVNELLTSQLTLTVSLVLRDWFFEGRGIGKNLMGLQVVDVKTGLPCSLIQSIKRNLTVLGPPLVLYIIMALINLLMIFHVKEVASIAGLAKDIINTVGFVYVIIVIPYEAYRAYARADGRRLGDQIAGTAIVEAPMDFSKPLPRE